MRLGIFLTPWRLSLIHSARPSRRGALFHYHLPPFLSSRLFTHEDRRMYARLRLPVGVHYGRISHPGKPTLLQEELCYAPPIPIEGKSCLVIPRLQHVRSLTPRAAAAVSRTDRRLTCTGTYVV